MATTTGAVTASSDEIEALPWEPLREIGSGVQHKVLWRTGDSVAGVMELAPGGQVNAHVHARSHHHLWVVEGELAVHGTPLGPGSFAHVPEGVEHELVNVGDGPCRFLYTYVR